MQFLLFIFLACLLFLVLFTFLLARFFLSVITVEGHSMSPTLIHSDRVLVLRYWPNKWLRKGQIIVGNFRKVMDLPDDQDAGLSSSPLSDSYEAVPRKFIKRLIGLPSDTISIPISEVDEELRVAFRLEPQTDENFEWHIPEGFCFVRSDGTGGDSILWGPIPLDYLDGVMLFKLP